MEQSFGRTLAFFRSMKGVSQADLVNADLSLSASYIAKLEGDLRGGRKNSKSIPILSRR